MQTDALARLRAEQEQIVRDIEASEQALTHAPIAELVRERRNPLTLGIVDDALLSKNCRRARLFC